MDYAPGPMAEIGDRPDPDLDLDRVDLAPVGQKTCAERERITLEYTNGGLITTCVNNCFPAFISPLASELVGAPNMGRMPGMSSGALSELRGSGVRGARKRE